MISAALLAFLPDSAKWVRLVALWFTNFQSIGFVLGLVMLSSNMAGYTKKSFTSGLIFCAYCAGNVSAPLAIRPLDFTCPAPAVSADR